MTDDLMAFLRARLDEDAATAQAARPGPWELRWNGQEHELWSAFSAWPIAEWSYAIHTRGERGEPERAGCDTGTQEHIARHDPVRVLAEIAAKKAILDLHGPEAFDTKDADGNERIGYRCATCHAEDFPCPTVELVAAPYADHPGYREEWRP